MMDVATRDLVKSVKQGNTEAFGVLFERYKDSIYKTSLSMTGDPDDAEDLTVEAFQRAHRALLEQTQVNKFEDWMYVIVKNVYVDEWRKRKRRGEVRLDADLGESETWLIADPDGSWQPEAVAREEAIQRLVWDGIKLLPYTYRMVLALQIQMGLRPDEIAEQMGIKRGTVYTQLSRARDLMEENVTLLILSRVGRRACPKLDELLKRVELWQLTDSQRRGLLRHIEGCAVC
ncbi:MAG TPA: sigma-70 family RNA polymerase sigma factor, partial [Chloroflexi bacterium]|nr:sigma-70 family RNA polymerase sigma factor [Chloroflexota bacterium]